MVPVAAASPAIWATPTLLSAHEPFPALALDRHWNLVAANRAVSLLIAGAAEFLLEPPVNVLRLCLHSEGMTPRIDNLPQWRAHLLERLKRQVEESADGDLAKLLAELTALPSPHSGRGQEVSDDSIAVPLRLRTDGGLLAFWSATMVFDAPRDVTLSEIMLETFLPADAATGERLRRLLSIPSSPASP